MQGAAPDGSDLVIGYEGLPEDGRRFENRSVAVFGMGNAGFETADALAPWCATPQHGLYSNKMALITADCGRMRSLRIKWP